MSTRDITEHLGEVYGATVSAATISRVTDVVADEIRRWQSRPVDPVYPIVYIESLNYQLRKVTKARGSFPSDAAALKLLYLAIRNINPERGSTPRAGTCRWTEALNAFATQFPDRLPL